MFHFRINFLKCQHLYNFSFVPFLIFLLNALFILWHSTLLLINWNPQFEWPIRVIVMTVYLAMLKVISRLQTISRSHCKILTKAILHFRFWSLSCFVTMDTNSFRVNFVYLWYTGRICSDNTYTWSRNFY
jgi:hypothetical protein